MHESRAMRPPRLARERRTCGHVRCGRFHVDEFMHGWAFWAVIAVVAIGLMALIGWGLVWMLALSD